MDAESHKHMPLMTNSSGKVKAHLPGLSLESPRKKEAEKQADQWHQRIWQKSHDTAKNCPNLDITWGRTSYIYIGLIPTMVTPDDSHFVPTYNNKQSQIYGII
jgi:hypothetical protein